MYIPALMLIYLRKKKKKLIKKSFFFLHLSSNFDSSFFHITNTKNHYLFEVIKTLKDIAEILIVSDSVTAAFFLH